MKYINKRREIINKSLFYFKQAKKDNEKIEVVLKLVGWFDEVYETIIFKDGLEALSFRRKLRKKYILQKKRI
jgi:hypothetical protein